MILSKTLNIEFIKKSLKTALLFLALLLLAFIAFSEQAKATNSPADFRVFAVEARLLNQPVEYLPATINVTTGPTTKVGKPLPLSDPPYNGRHFDTDLNTSGPNTNNVNLGIPASTQAQNSQWNNFIWCGAAGRVAAFDFRMQVTLLDDARIGNNYVVDSNGIRRYGKWEALEHVVGSYNPVSVQGKSIVTTAVNPAMTSVHFIFREEPILGNINVWKYSPSTHAANGDLAGTPDPIKNLNVGIRYPYNYPRDKAWESRNNPYRKDRVWSGLQWNYYLDFEVPKGWRIARVLMATNDDQSQWRYNNIFEGARKDFPVEKTNPDCDEKTANFCVYRVKDLRVPLSGTLSVNLFFDKLGEIKVNRYTNQAAYERNDFTNAPGGEVAIYNYKDNKITSPFEAVRFGPKSTQNGYTYTRLWTINPYGLNNTRAKYANWYYRIETTYSGGRKPRGVIVTGNRTTSDTAPNPSPTPALNCDASTTSGKCWVDFIAIDAFKNNNLNLANISPRATVNFIYDVNTPPPPVNNPWLQTKGGNVISEGSITGPRSGLPGARISGSPEKEAEYLVMAALGGSGYFCSSQFYILTNIEVVSNGSCTNGSGYIINYPRGLGEEGEDKVIKSIENTIELYKKQNGSPNSCPNLYLIGSPSTITTLPGAIYNRDSSGKSCPEGSIYVIEGNATVPSGIAAVTVNGRSTIYIKGNLTIDGTLKYNYGLGAGNIKDIPNLAIIVKGNVNINGSVANLDAAIYATGKINTCSNLPGQNTVPTVCNKRLFVNGMLVSRGGFDFNRTYVDADRRPAELIVLTPQTYIFPPPGINTEFFEDSGLEAAVIDDGQYPPQF